MITTFCSCRCFVLNLISLLFFFFFVVSTGVQTYFGNDIPWIVYCFLQAAVPAMFWTSYYTEGQFPIIAIYFMAFVNAFVMGTMDIIIVREGENLDVTYEVGGASIALYSSLYHSIMAKYCIDDDDDAKTVDEEVVFSV